MKKIQLSIKEPCHENWAQMSQAEKGKFCSSCQKHVIDFTNMSDRQLAEFFKKPVSGVCGRFHNDQLERSIIIPKKRIPWLRYFFQFTWPAFVLMVKSCGMKKVTIGKPVEKVSIACQLNEIKTGKLSSSIIGDTTIVITGTDDTSWAVECKMDETFSDSVGAISDHSTIDATEFSLPITLENKIMVDTGNVDSFTPVTCNTYTMGFVMPGQVIEIKDEQKKKPVNEKVPAKKNIIKGFDLFPNPAQAGHLVTIVLKDSEFPREVSLLNGSGQLVHAWKMEEQPDALVLNIMLPMKLARGYYFLNLVDRNNNVVTKQLLIQ